MLYEDDMVVVIARDSVILPGQITIIPKEHFPIFELVPDDIIKRCAVVANKVGVAAFESFNSQGTNVLIQNSISGGQKMPHFAVEVIPRQENDGLNLQWQPQQIEEAEMDQVFTLLKEEGGKLKDVGKGKHTPKTVDVDGDSPAEPEEEKDNYMIKSLRRTP